MYTMNTILQQNSYRRCAKNLYSPRCAQSFVPYRHIRRVMLRIKTVPIDIALPRLKSPRCWPVTICERCSARADGGCSEHRRARGQRRPYGLRAGFLQSRVRAAQPVNRSSCGMSPRHAASRARGLCCSPRVARALVRSHSNREPVKTRDRLMAGSLIGRDTER